MEYKHFSHLHSLIFHQMEQGVEIHCSGCELPASGSVYSCWQCSFFLHEQCFHASRSMQHPSHPPHPLTLIPYPTYPSASFICNSCNQSGTGFSYTCSNCDFDIHVHCAYTPQIPTNVPYNLIYSSHQPVLNYPNFLQHSLPNEIATQETVPISITQMGPETASHNKPVLEPQKVKHFSHQHALNLSEIFQEEDDQNIVCSGCEQDISTSSLAYSCTMSKCNFNLHKSCFELPPEIRHKSHPEHPLILLSSPPYKGGNEFTCNACFGNGTAFAYHCSTCKFDLHVSCAFLSETMKREDHEHPLTLLYSSPYKKVKEDDEDVIFICDVCKGTVDERCWVYYCQECDYGTELGCVTAEEYTEEVSLQASALKAQLHMQRLQIQMEMSRQSAQLIANMGQSLLNLV